MRNTVLLSGIVVLGIVLTAFTVLASAGDLAPAVTRAVIMTAKALSWVGCIVAFSQFSKGDYLRKAWGLLAFASFCLFEAQMVRDQLQPVMSPAGFRMLRDVFVFGSNVCTPLAMLFFARALSNAGLDLAGDRRVRITVTAVVGVLTAMLAGRALFGDLGAFFGGDFTHMDNVFSDIGDVITMVMLAPIVYNVLTLRGGMLSWPFLMLAASTASWLVYDGVGALTDMFGLFTSLATPLKNGAWMAALLFQGAAGLAHYWAVSGRVTAQPVDKPA